MEEITVVVVDDHPLFRQGVVETLSLEPDIEVVRRLHHLFAGLGVARLIPIKRRQQGQARQKGRQSDQDQEQAAGGT